GVGVALGLRGEGYIGRCQRGARMHNWWKRCFLSKLRKQGGADVRGPGVAIRTIGNEVMACCSYRLENISRVVREKGRAVGSNTRESPAIGGRYDQRIS